MLDAYNSNVCEGLPVGPINNPGMNAIEAALAPADTDYFYFLSDEEGEYHFSRNYEEHLAYLQQAGDEAHGTNVESEEETQTTE